MLLFDPAERTYLGPSSHIEDEYSFLCRSAWAASDCVRELLETWFARYPSEEQPELRRRFESSFDAAFFELAIHELLHRLGADVTVHPVVPSATTRPDFLVAFPDGLEVFVEAVVARDETQADSAERARQGLLYDEINKIDSPNFFLHVTSYRNPEGRQPSGRRVRAFLEREIKRFDPDHVTELYEERGLEALPALRYEDGSFVVCFSLMPKSLQGRQKPSRAIGMYPMVSRWGGVAPAIRNAVDRKATRYGQLDLPLVVAVNCTSRWGFDRIDVMEALFGTESLVAPLSGGEPNMRRQPNGVWYGPKGAQNTRLSAVLYAELVLWGLPQSSLRLFLNPWAVAPLDATAWTVPIAQPKEGKIQWVDGAEPSELYGLPADWSMSRHDNAAI